MQKIVISGFSDEIAKPFDQQLTEFNKLGIEHIEIRGIDGRNISNLTMEEVQAVKKKLDKADIKVSCIGSPCGKIEITEPFEEHFEQFKQTIAIAEELGVRYIRIFSFFIPAGKEPGQYKEEVIRRLKQMVAYVEGKDVVLLHENEKEIYGDIKDRCLELYQSINHPQFKLLFDFANFIQVGEDTASAYDDLKDFIEYFHIKDARKEDGIVVVPGTGDAFVREILTKAIKENKYSGFLSLEPHLVNFDGLAELEKDPVKQAEIERVPVEAFTKAHQALTRIIDQIEAA